MALETRQEPLTRHERHSLSPTRAARCGAGAMVVNFCYPKQGVHFVSNLLRSATHPVANGVRAPGMGRDRCCWCNWPWTPA